jgi:hypothetical protein
MKGNDSAVLLAVLKLGVLLPSSHGLLSVPQLGQILLKHVVRMAVKSDPTARAV